MNHALSATALLAALVVAGAARADEIHKYNGKPQTDVTILDETFKEVTFRLPALKQPQTVSMDEVKEVIHDSFSEKYEIGLEAMGAGDFGKAALLFAAEAGDPPARKKWLGQYARFNEGECYRAQRKFDDALGAYDKLLKEYPETRFYGDAFLKRAQCYLAQNKDALARTAFEELKKAVADKGLPKRWNLVADFQLLRLDEAKDPKKSFEKEYIELQKRAAAAGVKDVANMARLRIGYSLIAQGQLEDARVYFQEIIDDRQASDVRTVAGAYNGLGNTYVAKKNPSAEDWETAMFAFGRAAIHYGDQLQALGDQEILPEALYWFARCLEQRTVDRDRDSHRANILYGRVINEFGSTHWAQKAADR